MTSRLLVAALAATLSVSPVLAEDAPLPKPADIKTLAIHPAKVSLTGMDDAAQIIVTAR